MEGNLLSIFETTASLTFQHRVFGHFEIDVNARTQRGWNEAELALEDVQAGKTEAVLTVSVYHAMPAEKRLSFRHPDFEGAELRWIEAVGHHFARLAFKAGSVPSGKVEFLAFIRGVLTDIAERGFGDGFGVYLHPDSVRYQPRIRLPDRVGDLEGF